ncbi:MAG: hypothetical protein IJC59_08060, partial [Lachnospiraceae bacterium]|nr:hypothetical protein [Lachnospiraceae bacterium]
MKLFGRKGLESEEERQDDFELDMIDLDDTDSWSKLEVAHALAQERQQSRPRTPEKAMLEEISRELVLQEEESDEVEALPVEDTEETEEVGSTYPSYDYEEEMEYLSFSPEEEDEEEEEGEGDDEGISVFHRLGAFFSGLT